MFTSWTQILESEGQRWIPGFKTVQCSLTKVPHDSRKIGMCCANSSHAINHVHNTLNWQILDWLSKGQDRCRCLGRRVLTPSPWREFHPRHCKYDLIWKKNWHISCWRVGECLWKTWRELCFYEWLHHCKEWTIFKLKIWNLSDRDDIHEWPVPLFLI